MNEILYANIAALGSIEKLAAAAPDSTIYLLKGAAIITLSSSAMSSRAMDDTDILAASPDEYNRVTSALERMGFKKRRGDSQAYEDIYGRVRPFDVHDNLWYLSGAERRSILAASRRASTEMPPNIRALSPEDLCADIIIHSACHGAPDERWLADLDVVARRFGHKAVALGRAKASRYCGGIESPAFSVRGGSLPREGFIRRFAILGTLEKKAAYTAAVLFPSKDFIARRYDSSSAAGILFYRFARPFALLVSAFAALVAAMAFSVSKLKYLPFAPLGPKPS